nr:RNA-directed DNA polymerase, eukaryota [Tanacetum cinerariifolium]
MTAATSTTSPKVFFPFLINRLYHRDSIDSRFNYPITDYVFFPFVLLHHRTSGGCAMDMAPLWMCLFLVRDQRQGKDLRSCGSLSNSALLGKQPKIQDKGGSYVNVVKGNNLPSVISTSPALVLDESCIVSRNLDFFVLGETKNPSSITNLYVLLSNEGFHNVKLQYLGGLWVMIEMESLSSKEKLLKHEGVASWFNNLGNAQEDFVSKERILWVDIEGVPIHAWTLEEGSSTDSGTANGDNINNANSDLDSDNDAVSDTLYGENMDNLDKDNSYNHPQSVNVPSPDPFNIHELLRKNAAGVPKTKSSSLSHKQSQEFCSHVMVEQSQDAEVSRSNFNHVGNNKHMSSKGGSILEVLDGMIKVGKAMSYDMGAV